MENLGRPNNDITEQNNVNLNENCLLFMPKYLEVMQRHLEKYKAKRAKIKKELYK